MPFARPSIAQLITRVVGDFETELQTVGSVLRRTMIRVNGAGVAGASHGLHGHLDFLAKQIFPDKAEDEYLVRHASLYGVTKNPPTFATAEIQITGDGTVVPSGSIYTRADGAEYELVADVNSNDPSSAGTVVARAAGAAGTLPVNTVLTLQSPIAGVQSTATVSDLLSDGNDVEKTESFRARFLAYLASPPQGGNEEDFIAWTKQVTGVTRAWITKWGSGPGTVVVRFARDGDLSPIPDAGEIENVQTYLDNVAPVAAKVIVAPIVAMPINFTISVTPDTALVRAAVAARLTEKFKRTAPSVPIPVSALETAIGSAQGVTDFTMLNPSAPVAPAANQLPMLGTITWV